MSYAEMKDEFDRYQRLLNDWNQGKGDAGESSSEPQAPSSQSSAKPATGRPRARLRSAAETSDKDGRFPKGTILVLDDEELVVYRRPMGGEPYDMVYSLLADGKVRIEAVQLDEHEISELGVLPATELKRLQTKMLWTHAQVVDNCAREEDKERIPEPACAEDEAPPQAAPRPAPTPRANDTVDEMMDNESASVVEPPRPSGPKKLKIRRGQRLRLKFGDRAWDAVYWGKDSTGTVVAHNTHDRWTLMHLDLNRFKESMVVDPKPDDEIIASITQSLNTAQRDMDED